MDSFEYEAKPGRVLFGTGTIRKVPEELARLKLSRPLVLCTPQQVGQAEELRAILEEGGVETAGLFTEAAMHTPVDVTERAVEAARASGAESVVAIGGGSTTGL